MVLSQSPMPSPRCDEPEARTGAADVAWTAAAAAAAAPVAATTDAAAPIDRLRELLVEAGTLDLADDAGWRRLRDDVQATLGELIAERAVPDHLAVRHDDPVVVVRRTIAAAWRYTTR